MDLPVRRPQPVPVDDDEGVEGPRRVVADLEHAGDDGGVPARAANAVSRSTNGPSSGSAYAARSEPGAPKSRMNASGSSTSPVSGSSASADRVEGGAVLGGVEGGRLLHQGETEAGSSGQPARLDP